MKKLFTQKMKQGILVLFLLAAGLFTSGKANACTAMMRHDANHLSVSFTDSGSSALGHAHSVTWKFGDGTTSHSDNPSHTYSHNGTFVICLFIYDSSTSCLDSTCSAVYLSNCSLAASYTYSISGRAVTFVNTTVTSGTTTYIWHFGDGSVDSTSGDTVTHTYSGTDNDFSTYLTVYEHSTTCTANESQHVRLCRASAIYHAIRTGHSVYFTVDSTYTATVTYSWTFGDGSSSTSATPTHNYTSTGSYTVCLTATDTVTSCSSTHCETVIIADPTYCIYGDVSAGTDDPIPCVVYLISFNPSDSSLTALDSMVLRDSSSSYHFCGLSNGTYYTKAALLSTNTNYSSYIPTYHSGATNWASATAIVVSGSYVTGANIAMVSGTNPGGPGFIGGLISAGANKVGDPEVGILVILYNSKNEPIAFTHSGKDGKYAFSNLAYGTYSLMADIPGKKSYPVAITLDETHKTVSTVDLSVHIKSVTGSIESGIDKAVLVVDNAMVYPNPVTDKLIINTNLHATQNASIIITDITGKTISTVDQTIAAGQQALEIDANTLPAGMYFVKILLNKDNRILESRFVKAQ